MTLSGCNAQTAFSPNGNGTGLIIDTINGSKKSIRMLTYSFTEPKIGQALLNAHKRGVDVKIAVDDDHDGHKHKGWVKRGPSVAEFLSTNGVPLVVTQAYAIQHNKVLVVDGVTVQTGSFNYSRAAESKNAENVLVMSNCPQIARPYTADFQKVWETGTSLKAKY